jgi:hypothetical protein
MPTVEIARIRATVPPVVEARAGDQTLVISFDYSALAKLSGSQPLDALPEILEREKDAIASAASRLVVTGTPGQSANITLSALDLD